MANGDTMIVPLGHWPWGPIPTSADAEPGDDPNDPLFLLGDAIWAVVRAIEGLPPSPFSDSHREELFIAYRKLLGVLGFEFDRRRKEALESR